MQTNVYTKLENKDEIHSTDEKTWEVQAIGEIVSLQTQMSDDVYKGYLYEAKENKTKYQENYILEISDINNTEKIEIVNTQDEFTYYNEEKNERTVMPTNNTTYFNQTVINKENMLRILGEQGQIKINKGNDEEIIIHKDTKEDDNGNIVINYPENEVKNITITTTKPAQEGTIRINNQKTINANIGYDRKDIEAFQYLEDNVIVNGVTNLVKMNLLETKSEMKIEMSQKELSTSISNNVEIKAVLLSNNNKYELASNPQVKIQLPEQVDNITVNSIDLLYEDELQIVNCETNDRAILITLDGEQTTYKEGAIEGATIVVNASIDVNRKATTQETEIISTYLNKGAEVNTVKTLINLVAPTDITTIYDVKDLNVETTGQENNIQTAIPIGAEGKQLQADFEIINNQDKNIENVKIVGDFPTNNDDNNMDIKVLGKLNTPETVKTYYSENSDATEDLELATNGWTEQIQDSSKVSKYLLVIDNLEAKQSVQANYQYEIPENLEYNQVAETKYQVKYQNEETQVPTTLKSTNIVMKTGIGPEAEVKLTATVGGKAITGLVKNGEVIKYTIEVANTGTEDISNVRVNGRVPDGTTMVVVDDDSRVGGFYGDLGYEYNFGKYYKELTDRNYEETIDQLNVGEKVIKQYEVRVNNNTAVGTNLSNIVQINYGEVSKQTQEAIHATDKGSIRLTTKRVTDRKIDFNKGMLTEFHVIVENISGKQQDNVKVKLDFSDKLSIAGVKLTEAIDLNIENTLQYNSTLQDIEYSEELNIGTIEAGKSKVLAYTIRLKEAEKDDNEIYIYAVGTDRENIKHLSNNWYDEIYIIDASMTMSVNTESQYIKTDDIVTYTITVTNNGDRRINGAQLLDRIPTQLAMKRIMRDGVEEENTAYNFATVKLVIEPHQTTIIQIETIVNYSLSREEAEQITNTAILEDYLGNEVAKAEVSLIIQPDVNPDIPDKPDKPDQPDTPDNPDNPDKPDIANGKSSIAGVAWFDKNENGKKDPEEELLSNIKVKLLNVETNNMVKHQDGQILEATTNDKGIYILNKIKNGKYIVIFDYDTSIYDITKYKAQGVLESENSNVIKNELTIQNEKKKVASTDIIQIEDNNIPNINIGLIKLKNFDLALNKYISKIIVQNEKGTTVRGYNDESMAKIEIDAKQMNATDIFVEYKIVVTNQGEIAGYARKIADYMDSDWEFSTTQNKEWYRQGNTLYTASLANQKIKPGESKVVTLTLSKTLTENKAGVVENTAEIAEDYNELGITDSNSIPGNKVNGENDISTAELLLSIRTGGIIYISIAVIIVAILSTIAFIVIRNKKKDKKE